MTRALLSLGSNLGDRAGQLREAVAGLDGDGLVVAVSGVYETPAWGGAGPGGQQSPAYLNAAVMGVDDGDDPGTWLERAQALEHRAGRTRDPGWPFAPRTLDVDVIMVWDSAGAPVISDDPTLTLPHPRAHLRAFVLRPWLDIQPYAQLPGHGWVYDLVRTDVIAADLPEVRACPDVSLQQSLER